MQFLKKSSFALMLSGLLSCTGSAPSANSLVNSGGASTVDGEISETETTPTATPSAVTSSDSGMVLSPSPLPQLSESPTPSPSPLPSFTVAPQLSLISGIEPNTISSIYFDEAAQVSYAVTSANIFIISEDQGSVLNDKNSGGEDDSNLSGWDPSNRIIYHRCRISATEVKLCKSRSVNASSPLSVSEVVTNLNNGGNDQLGFIVDPSFRTAC